MCFRRIILILGLAGFFLSSSLVISGQVPDRIYGSKFRESSRLVKLAKQQIDKQHYQLALDLLNESLQYQTDNIDAYFTRAVVKENMQNPEGALTDYQIVLLLDSTYREAAFNRARLRYKHQQFQRAINDFRKVLTMGSSGTQILYFKGTPLNNEGSVSMQGMTTTYSMDADIHNYIGLCYQALDQHVLAIEAFGTAQSLGKDANYYVNRGLSYSSLDNDEKAIADFHYALELRPDDPVAQFNLTQTLESSGNMEMKAYDEIIEDNPEFASAYANRALAKINSGDVNGAIDDYDMAVSIDQNDPVLYVNRALAKEKTGDIRAALSDYNQALKLDPSDAKAYRSRGRVLFELQEIELSLEDLDEAIKLDPDFGGAYFNRALIHRKLGNQDKTCADLTQAQRMGVQNASKALAQYKCKFKLN